MTSAAPTGSVCVCVCVSATNWGPMSAFYYQSEDKFDWSSQGSDLRFGSGLNDGD